MKTTHKTFLFLTAAIAFFLPQEAFADSPITGIAEIKVGGYYPQIDSEFQATPGPFEQFFGKEDMWYIESDWSFYFFNNIVKAGLGFSLGYSSKEADVKTSNSTSDETPGKTGFSVIPMKATALLRYDYSALHHNIPLVPFAKLGVGAHYWSITNADTETATANGIPGYGLKFGYHAAFGAQLLLDIIQPNQAAYMDLFWGVNHSYLFVEYNITRVGDTGPGFNLSDDMWLFGLAFEF